MSGAATQIFVQLTSDNACIGGHSADAGDWECAENLEPFGR
jgi:hypothetical protein